MRSIASAIVSSVSVSPTHVLAGVVRVASGVARRPSALSASRAAAAAPGKMAASAIARGRPSVAHSASIARAGSTVSREIINQR
eukprot:scaffold69892_cov71-Phaeocystis_antarctica.AAC.8